MLIIGSTLAIAATVAVPRTGPRMPAPAFIVKAPSTFASIKRLCVMTNVPLEVGASAPHSASNSTDPVKPAFVDAQNWARPPRLL